MNRKQIYWICQLSGWGVYAVSNALLLNAFMRMNLRSNLGVLGYGFLGILVTHILRHYLHRSSLLSRPWGRIITQELVLVPLCAAALAALALLNWRLWSGSSMASPRVAEHRTARFATTGFAGADQSAFSL